MADIIPQTTAVTSCDDPRALLMKILHRLNLNSQVQVDVPAANVAVTNTPLPIDFDGPQPVYLASTGNVNVTNFPASQTVDGTVNVGNFPASQNVVVTNAPTVDAGLDFTDDGHVSVVANEFAFEVAHSGTYREGGVNKAAFIYRAIGRRAGFNSTSVLQDIGEFLTGDTLPNLTGLENLELVSSSAQDDPSPAGTGTWTVRITYLNTSYVLTHVDYALNGVIPVPVAEKMLFVYCMEALTGGTSEVSAGNIDLRVPGGAVHERITAGGNRSLTNRFMVPDNYKAYIVGWYASAIGQTMDCRLRTTTLAFDNAVTDRYLFKSNAYLAAGQNTERVMVYKKLPARAKCKVSCLAGGTGPTNRVDSEVIFLLVQD